MHIKFNKLFFLSLLISLFFFFSRTLSASQPKYELTIESDIVTLSKFSSAISKTESPTVGNNSEYAAQETSEAEKILVVLVDSYGTQNYSKIVITDVNMELSILIAKDIFDKLPEGIYTIIASSANDLISQKLIIQ